MRLPEIDRGDGLGSRLLIGFISTVSGMRLPDAAAYIPRGVMAAETNFRVIGHAFELMGIKPRQSYILYSKSNGCGQPGHSLTNSQRLVGPDNRRMPAQFILHHQELLVIIEDKEILDRIVIRLFCNRNTAVCSRSRSKANRLLQQGNHEEDKT